VLRGWSQRMSRGGPLCVFVCVRPKGCRKGFCNTHSWKISFRTFLAQSRGYGSVSNTLSLRIHNRRRSLDQMNLCRTNCTISRFHRQGLN